MSSIRDVAEADFAAEVLAASRTRGVVVDFWAPWCGPCHQLAPVLERVAARHAGDVDLVKVNVDQAPALAGRYQVQGIPAVKAFRHGTVVGELTGVQPEAAVERLFAGVAPSQADRLVDRDAGALDRLRADAAGGDAEAALELGRALAAQRVHAEALEALLAAVRHPASRDQARHTILEVFRVLGDDHELVRAARPKLAAALF